MNCSLRNPIVLLLALLLAISGRAAPDPGKGSNVQSDPALVQQNIFRFCDEYSNRVSGEFDRLIAGRPGLTAAEAVRLKLSLNYRVLEIAAGPNDYENLCDLVVMVAMTRHTFERHWMPEMFPDNGAPALAKLREYETQVFDLAQSSLGAEATSRLREKITPWLAANYSPGMALYTRYTGLTAELAQTPAAKGGRPNLLKALMLDPLAGLDPTVREITKSRLFAERAMFVAQRMPKVVRMEIELMSYRMVDTPEARQLLADLNRVSESVDRVSRTTEALPAQIRTEREALVKALDEQSPALTKLMTETHAALEAATQATANVNAVVLSTDQMLKRLGVPAEPGKAGAGGAPGTAAAAPGEPFRIQDYTAAAAQLAVSAERLNTLVQSLDHTLVTATSPQVAEKITAASQAALAGGRDLVDHVFWRALLLVGIIFALIPFIVWVCRRIPRRDASRTP
jgi:hypothetical protein